MPISDVLFHAENYKIMHPEFSIFASTEHTDEDIDWEWSDEDDYEYDNDYNFEQDTSQDKACTMDNETIYDKFKRYECYFKKSCDNVVHSTSLGATTECFLYGLI